MRKKSHIVVQKYIDDLADSQRNFEWFGQRKWRAKKMLDGDVYIKITDHIEVQNGNEEQ